MKKKGLLVAAFTLVVAGGIGIFLNGNSSEGQRSGVITKLSRKGVFNKSWEGQLAMDNFVPVPSEDGKSTVMSNTFEFSVRDDDTLVVSQLHAMQASGARVNLSYEEPRVSNVLAYDTDYRVTVVEQVAVPSTPVQGLNR